MKKALELVLAAVIVGSALAFGGVQPLTYSLAEAVLFASVLWLLWSQAREGEIVLRLPIWPVLFLLLIVLQLIPLPPSVLARLSPAQFARLDAFGSSSVSKAWTTLSIYPHDTVLALVKALAYFVAFALAAYVFDSRTRKSTLIKTLIYLGVFEAAYGTMQCLTGWQKIFTYTKQAYTQEATGTYINHNHFAGLLELTFPFVVAYIFYYFQIWVEQRKRRFAPTAIQAWRSAGPQALLYLFLLVIIIIGVILSRSRGGILGTAFTVVFVACLAQFRVRRKGWLFGLFLFLILAAGYGLWIGLDPILARFAQLQQARYLQWEGRLSFWKDSLGLVREHPLAGIGLGNFGLGFRRVQTSWVTFFVDHAHNDYVEFTTETGFLGVALLFLPIIYLLGKMIATFLTDQRRYRPAVLLGCIGSTLALLIHSITDFNLAIPANAIVFAAVLGIGYQAACVEPREDRRQITPSGRPSP